MSDPISPVALLCLAILHEGEATGYEIKKASVEGDYRHFVDASYGSIYPALSRLAAEGYVTSREVAQSGRPARKVYAITDRGRTVLLNTLMQPPGPDVFRARFLLVAKFAELLSPDVLRAALCERRSHLAAEIAHLRNLSDAAAAGSGLAWIVDYGTVCTAASLAHLDAHGDALVAIAERAEALRRTPGTVASAAE